MVPEVRTSIRTIAGYDPQVEGASVISASSPDFVARTCGSVKLCAGPESVVPRAVSSPMKLPTTRVLDDLGGSSTSFLGASPNRVALRNPSALD